MPPNNNSRNSTSSSSEAAAEHHTNNPLSTPPPVARPSADSTIYRSNELEEPTPHISNVTANNNDTNDSETQQAQTSTTSNKKTELYKSTRLKGYITLILASVINYSAARRSGEAVNSNAVASSITQRQYAEAVSLLSCVLSLLAFIAHLDRWSPKALQSMYQSIFHDGSKLELCFLLFLVVWWGTATIIQTTVRGIAGDGKGQYNLYYSTWGCCWTCFWTLERWLVALGWASFKSFISSWPFRAPGWIAILGTSFLTLMWYLDLYWHHEQSAVSTAGLYQHYQEVGDGQWQWLLFVGIFSLIPSLVFVLIELFRETSNEDSGDGGGAMNNESGRNNNSSSSHPPQTPRHLSFVAARASTRSPPNPGDLSPNSSRRQSRVGIPQRQNALPDKTNATGGKGPLENILEGFCLVLLVFAWIPTVIVATTPGGAASLVGNAYFFTWINTVFVMETFIWFVHDLRKGVHSALQVKEQEYRKRQQEVLDKSRALEFKRHRENADAQFLQDDLSLDQNLAATARISNDTITTRRKYHNNNNNNMNRLQPPVFDEILDNTEDNPDLTENADLTENVEIALSAEEDDAIARALEEDMQRPDLNGGGAETEEENDGDGPATPTVANRTEQEQQQQNNNNNNNSSSLRRQGLSSVRSTSVYFDAEEETENAENNNLDDIDDLIG